MRPADLLPEQRAALARVLVDWDPIIDGPALRVDEAIASLKRAPAVTESRLRVLDRQQMVREEPLPINWLLRPLIAEGRITMLFAEPGAGKSMFILSASAAMAHNDSIAGMDTSPGSVVYVDGENGEHEIHRRIRSSGIEEHTPIEFVDAEGFDLRRESDELGALVDRYDPKLLVIDSLRALSPGLDENDSREVEAILAPLRRIAHGRQVAVVFIHHTSKGRKTYRGSSALAGSVDAAFHLDRAEGDPDVARRVLRVNKMRFAEEPPAIWLRIAAEDGAVLVEGAEPFDEAPTPKVSTREALKPQLLDMAIDARTQAALARAVGRPARDQSVRRALHDLAKDGLMRQRPDGLWELVSSVIPYKDLTPDTPQLEEVGV